MPTTRFASAIEKSNSTGTDQIDLTNVNSINNSREQAFNARKKREMPADLSPQQNAMIQFVDCIIEYNSLHAFLFLFI